MANLGTRDDWRATKKKFGIPDAVCKFSMGEKLGAFAKAETAAKGDIDKQVELWDGMLGTLTTYEKALKAMKVDKFGGKTPADKASNFNKAKQEIKGMLDQATAARGLAVMQQRPLAHVKTHFDQVNSAYKSLDRNNKGAVETFYRQDLRNTLGLAIKTALKGGLRPDIKTALTKYEEYMGGIDSAFNHAKNGQQPDLNAIYTDMGKALALLPKTFD